MNTILGILFPLLAIRNVGAVVLAPEPTYPAKLSARAIDGIKAIVPSTSGQIGINPVINDLGDPSTYIGQIIEVDTQWITLDTATVTTTSSWLNLDVGSQWLTYEEEVEDVSTAWINKNTQWLTVETINPTSTSTVQLIVATATAAAAGQSEGDISIIMSEGLAIALDKSVHDAVASCKVPSTRMVRRDLASDFTLCIATAGAAAIAAGGIFDTFVDSAVWDGIEVKLTESLESLIKPAIAYFSKIQRAQMGIYMAIAAVAVKVVFDWEQLNAGVGSEPPGPPVSSGPIGKVNIPAAGVGFMPGPSPTVNSCKTQPTKNSESPLCIDYDCLSSNNKTCDVEPHIYCPCLLVMPYIAQTANVSMMYLAQTLIQDFVESISMAANQSFTGCATTTTTYAATASFFAGDKQTFCDCGGSTVMMDYGISGTALTSWCKTFESIPTGFNATASPLPATITTTSLEPTFVKSLISGLVPISTSTPSVDINSLLSSLAAFPTQPTTTSIDLASLASVLWPFGRPSTTSTTVNPSEPYCLTQGTPFC